MPRPGEVVVEPPRPPRRPHPNQRRHPQVQDQADAEPDHGATVEADTLALADREEAREAALTGVRERAAKHEAKRQTATHAAAVGTAVATETEAPAEEAEEEPAEPERRQAQSPE